MSTTALKTPLAPQQKFWESTSFWVSSALFIFSMYTGFNTETGDVIANAVTQIFSGTFAVRKLVKNSDIDLLKWIKNPNTWMLLAGIVTPFFGEWVTELVPLIQNLINAIGGGNINSIITAAVSFIITIFYLRRDNAVDQVLEQFKITE